MLTRRGAIFGVSASAFGGESLTLAGSSRAVADEGGQRGAYSIGRTYLIDEFGGKGDGSSDNTAAIQAALTHIGRSGGGSLQFSDGIYRFDHIDADVDSITIFGNGSAILRCGLPKNSDVSAVWLRGDRITVRDLTIDYDEKIVTHPPQDLLARGKNGYGLRVGGRRDPQNYIAEEINIERVVVRDARNGGISIYKARVARVVDCNVNRTLGNGIGFDGCTDTIIAARNIVEDTGDDMLIVATDKSVASGTASVVFTGNILKKGFAKGIASTGVDRLLITSNIIEETFAGGIAAINDTFYGLGMTHNAIIANNYVFRAGWRFGLGMYHEEPCEVGHSVYVSSGTSNIKIVQNTLDSGYVHGVCVTRCPLLSVSGNSIVRHRGIPILLGDLGAGIGSRLSNYVVEINQIDASGVAVVAGGGRAGRVCGNIITYSKVPSAPISAIQIGTSDGCIVSGNVVGGAVGMVPVVESSSQGFGGKSFVASDNLVVK